MCKGKIGCKSCAKVGKKNCSSIKGINKIMKFSTKSFSVLKPAAVGLLGFGAAKLVNKIPMGSGKTVGDNAAIAGLVKIAVAAFAPGVIGSKVPMVKEAAVGVAIAGITDIVRNYLPSVASYIAAPMLPSGNPFGNFITNTNRIACSDDAVKYQ